MLCSPAPLLSFSAKCCDEQGALTWLGRGSYTTAAIDARNRAAHACFSGHVLGDWAEVRSAAKEQSREDRGRKGGRRGRPKGGWTRGAKGVIDRWAAMPAGVSWPRRMAARGGVALCASRREGGRGAVAQCGDGWGSTSGAGDQGGRWGSAARGAHCSARRRSSGRWRCRACGPSSSRCSAARWGGRTAS